MAIKAANRVLSSMDMLADRGTAQCRGTGSDSLQARLITTQTQHIAHELCAGRECCKTHAGNTVPHGDAADAHLCARNARQQGCTSVHS